MRRLAHFVIQGGLLEISSLDKLPESFKAWKNGQHEDIVKGRRMKIKVCFVGHSRHDGLLTCVQPVRRTFFRSF
jgi:hypothetical protein